MTVRIRRRINEHTQMDTFQNATLQGSGTVAFSVATFVRVPKDMRDDIEEVVSFLEETFASFAEDDTVDLEIQIGDALGT